MFLNNLTSIPTVLMEGMKLPSLDTVTCTDYLAAKLVFWNVRENKVLITADM